MATASRDSARAAGVDYRAGVLVQELVPNSRLSRRLPPNSIITAVMDQPVRDVEEFLLALAELDLSRGGLVTVVRPDGEFATIPLAIERNN
jgi:S1-C subfamily serine protease